jgi:hypothetical protein
MSADKIIGRFHQMLTKDAWIHLVQVIQEAYNDFKRGVNEKSRQLNLFYYKFRQNRKTIKPDRTPSCRRRREKQAQIKLLIK